MCGDAEEILYSPASVVQHNQYGGDSVHIWGAFPYNANRTAHRVFRRNIKADVYVNKVLEQLVLLFFQEHEEDYTFQQDNTMPHTIIQRGNFLNDLTFDVQPIL